MNSHPQSMETKYQIFISSTFEDLKEWRRSLMEKVLNMEHIPSGMEMFVSGDEEDWSVIHQSIDRCDIYVVLVGARYGSESDGVSFTQAEFRYAQKKAKKPILAFLLDDKIYKQERKKYEDLEMKRTPEEEEIAKKERANKSKLEAFRKEIQKIGKTELKHRIVNRVCSPDDFALKFSDALHQLLKNHGFKLAGWRRFSPDVGKNVFLQTVLNKLNDFSKLSHRCTDKSPELKQRIAEYFWTELSYQFLLKPKINYLYFESGSSLAYVSSAFRESQAFKLRHDEWKIRTNNILTYLLFTLMEDIPIRLFPHGPPEKKYGATYGDLLKVADPRHPTENKPLEQIQPEAVYPVSKFASDILPRDNSALILGAASGLELESKSLFPGPHTATFENKLIKRVLLETGHPIVLFLDEKKIHPPHKEGQFIVGECHNVCDPALSWDKVCRNHPLAICVGASTKAKLDEIVAFLNQNGLNLTSKVQPYSSNGLHNETWVTAVRNQVFDDRLGKPPIPTAISA